MNECGGGAFVQRTRPARPSSRFFDIGTLVRIFACNRTFYSSSLTR